MKTSMDGGQRGLLAPALGVTKIGRREFRWGERTYVMGIINMTPDSFSGDGLGTDVEAALAQARRFVEEGADLIDVGGESTRPGSAPVPLEEELCRVLPVVERLAAALETPISIDTYKAEVARQALAAGAALINDVWGFKHDPEIAQVAATYGAPAVLMHNRKEGVHVDVVAEVLRELQESIDIARRAGVPWENIIVDPGIGFGGKGPEENLALLRDLPELKALGRPILVGTSRKSTIGKVLGLPPDQRLEGTAATVAISIAHGAEIVRVHDVREMMRVVRMSDAIVRGRW